MCVFIQQNALELFSAAVTQSDEIKQYSSLSNRVKHGKHDDDSESEPSDHGRVW